MNDLYIITGATGGMGVAAARRFKDCGDLLLLDLSEEKLEELKNELGENVYTMVFDVSKAEDIEKVVDFIKPYGKFKALIHYAGVGCSQPWLTSKIIIDINEKGTVDLVNAVYDYAEAGSVIITTSSLAAHNIPASEEVSKLIDESLETENYDKLIEYCGDNTLYAYSYSKRAVVRFTKYSAVRFGEKGVRIVCISPGSIMTPMLQYEIDHGNESVIGDIISATPLKRLGQPEDIADVTEYLVSDKASFISGIDILVDGGAVYNMLRMRGESTEV